MVTLGSAIVCSLIACTSENDRERHGSEDCQDLVRNTVTETDHIPEVELREAKLNQALERLGREGSQHCERDLLLELMELQAGGSPERLVRSGERLMALKNMTDDQHARTRLSMAQAYFQLGMPRAFELAKDVFLEWDSMGVHSPKMFQVTSLLVQTYDLTGELDECVRLLESGLLRARRRGDPLWTADLLGRLAELHIRQGRPESAIPLQQEGLALLDRLLVNGAPKDTLLAVGGAVPANASPGADMVKDIPPRLLTIGDQLLLRHRLLVDLGEALLRTEQYAASRAAFLTASKLANGPLAGDAPAPFSQLGRLDLAVGDLSSAANHGEQALSQARALRDPRAIHEVANLLYQIHKARKDPARALSMHELARAYADSLGGKSFALALQKRQVLHEVRDDSLRMASALGREQLERANAELAARSNRTLAFAVGGIGMLLLAGGGTWFKVDRKRRQERHEREAAQLETQALRSQMNPHFIFNALNSINDYVRGNDGDSASLYLTTFARVMRAVLENSRQGEVPLGDDLVALRGYLELERMRLREKFDFTIEVASAIDQEQVLVPPLVVQPFVENAIWHGLSGKEGKGLLSIKVEPRGAQLVWVIADDGVGRAGGSQAPSHGAENAPVKKTSLGTAITRARLDLVQKQHGGKAGFRYVDVKNGTCVEVEMPLVKD